MHRNEILVPRGTLTLDEIEKIAAKLFKIGYAVRKESIKTGPNKGAKRIQYWVDGGGDDARAREAGSSEGRSVRDSTSN